MYITFEDYIRWYSPIEENIFERLAVEACRTMDKYTTGIDSVRKLKKAFPVDEDSAYAVKFTAAQLVNTLYQIYEAEQAANMSRGYIETENGLQRKIISRVEAGNEAISYMEGQGNTTAIDTAAKDTATKRKMLFNIIRDGLSGVEDANGVNLLYMGVYPGGCE